MLEKMTSAQDARAWRGNLPFESLYTAGLAGQKFLDGLVEGKILSVKCPTCKQVYVPVRQFCERCFGELTEVVEARLDGKVVSWTTCHIDLDGRKLATPVTVAAVRLEGTTTTLVHYYRSDRPSVGAKVRVAFKPEAERKGSILDIEGFVKAE